QSRKLGRSGTNALRIITGPTVFRVQIAAFLPAQLRKTSGKRRAPALCLTVILAESHQHADAPHPAGLLGLGRKRPRRHGAAEKREEIAALHGGASTVQMRQHYYLSDRAESSQ